MAHRQTPWTQEELALALTAFNLEYVALRPEEEQYVGISTGWAPWPGGGGGGPKAPQDSHFPFLFLIFKIKTLF